VVDLAFFEKIVDFAKEHDILVIHDFAYADLVFDGYEPPSFLQVPGAKDIGVEFFSLSKSYSMPGWRVGFCVGNSEIVGALRRIKSYLDYGIFQPIQIASIIALNGPQDCVKEIVETYKVRRDALIDGLNRVGWSVKPPKGTMFVWTKIPEPYLKMGSVEKPPKGTMFVWTKIPEPYLKMGSVEFSKMLIQKAKVAVSPGLGFGEYGDEYVRFALIENKMRINQAIRGIRKIL
jgi:alanine-synthesizing transaminase